VSEVAGVQEKRLLRLLGPARSKRHAEEAAAQPLAQGEQLQRAERLRHQHRRAGVVGLGLARAVAGQKHDRDLRRRGIALQLAAEVEPGRPRHVHVEDDDVRPCRAEALARDGRAAGLDHVDVGDVERRAE
jgi:hypothetical protein